MKTDYIIEKLENNLEVFSSLLKSINKEEYLYRPYSEHWCLLEIVCHLVDIERDDFRIRVQTVLEAPFKHPPAIFPEEWIESRSYTEQDFNKKIEEFTKERIASIAFLKALENPNWSNYYEHPTLGNLNGALFLRNWLAHDYLHIRQITRIKYSYLQKMIRSDCDYAGKW